MSLIFYRNTRLQPSPQGNATEFCTEHLRHSGGKVQFGSSFCRFYCQLKSIKSLGYDQSSETMSI
ncbi:hypothetical protein DENIT_80210 [Pseudomonas veronii]|nr:hypothetical protein DENIT_80210 [Pseudomonas veronii]